MHKETMRILVLMVTMVVPFGLAADGILNMKWRQWSKSLDYNGDGLISSSDVEVIRGKFINLHMELDAEKAKMTEILIEDWWNNEILALTPDGSFYQFVETCQREFARDKDSLYEKIHRCFYTLAIILDTNHDSAIEIEEYKIGNEAFGNDDMTQVEVEEEFERMHPYEGMVEPIQVAYVWAVFLTTSGKFQENTVAQSIGQELN